MVHRLQTIYASAGMHGPQFVEPYMSPPRTAAGSSRGVSPSKIYREPIIHVGDPYDIAIRVSKNLPRIALSEYLSSKHVCVNYPAESDGFLYTEI